MRCTYTPAPPPIPFQIVTAGANPISVKKGIDKTCEYLVAKLKEAAKPVKGREDIKNVATISAGNDETIGEMIAAALDKVRGCREGEQGKGMRRVDV